LPEHVQGPRSYKILLAQAGEHGAQTGGHAAPVHGTEEHGAAAQTEGPAHGTAAHGGHEEGHSANPLAHHPSSYFSGIAVLSALILLALAVITTRNLQRRNPSKRQSLIEQAVESITVFTVKAIGPGAERYVPLVATVFSFILVSNLFGVLPTVLAKSGEAELAHVLPSPTANLSMTIALALVVFVVVQAEGIRANGIGGHIKHFMGPIPALAPLLFPLELIGALAKPISLSIRLFGNVFGEETVIAVLVSMAVYLLPIWLPIPFQLPMLVFGVFGSIVQAGVFTILTCAYIALSLGEHSEHAEHHDEEHPEQLFGREAVSP